MVTTSSYEGPCKTILHMTHKLIKYNKVTMGCELAGADEVHGQLRDVGNIWDAELGCMENATTSNGKGSAISNDDTHVGRNELAGMEMSGIIGHVEGGLRVE